MNVEQTPIYKGVKREKQTNKKAIKKANKQTVTIIMFVCSINSIYLIQQIKKFVINDSLCIFHGSF